VTLSEAASVPFYELRVPAGLEGIAVHALQEDLGPQFSAEPESGLVRLSGHIGYDTLSRLGYLRSVGVGLGTVHARDIESAASQLAKRPWPSVDLPKGPRSFRLRFMDSGRLVSTAGPAAGHLAARFARETGLALDTHRAQREVWLDRRRGSSLVRLVVRDVTSEPTPAAGSLPLSTAALLVRSLTPWDSDVFWDPFAGSGVIPKARKHYRAVTIIASDKAPFTNPLFPIKRVDIFDDAAVRRLLNGARPNAIVSDLPWGDYDHSVGDLARFYRRVMERLMEIVSAEARCALLVARNEQAIAAIAECLNLVSDPCPILIHGHKASLLIGTIAWTGAAVAAGGVP
jgi:hypothetical protein